jgi:hypothetical protein
MYNNSNNSNKYSIVDFPNDGDLYGNFVSTIPKKAADKAFSALVKFINVNEKNEDFFSGKFIVFVIKNKSTGKMHKYIGSRIKLENKIKVTKNGVDMEYKYKNVIGEFKKELESI